MKERLFILRLVVSLVLLVAVAPGMTPVTAVQPRRTIPVAPNPAADLTRVATVRQITPARHAGNVGRFAGEARSQVRAGDLRPRPNPSGPCDVPGVIYTDTTWSPAECDHYVVTESVSVQPGATLTIEPGTTVKFDNLKVLAVAGTLVARGTEANPITFTSNQPGPAEGDWGYIYFADPSTDATFDGDGNYTGGSIIQHAVVEYAGGATVSDNGALRIEASSPFIDDCTIEHNQDNGICIWSNGKPRISGNTIIHNSGAGIHADSSSPTIQDNAIRDSSGSGIYVYSVFSGNPTIQDNTITGNAASSGGGGIHISYDTAVISGNVITGNSASQGGGIYLYATSPTISNNTITDNQATQENRGGGIYLGNGSFPTINDNDLYGNVTGNPANVPNDLYNGNEYGSAAVDATNNRWHTTDPAVIEDHIWHFMDDPALGIVSYDPFPSIPCTALGIIDTDTTWSPGECDPYVVTGNLSVQPGATLTIQPGTTVKFDRLKVLAVAGTLAARGIETDPITFTSNQSSPTAGYWGYIYFANPSTDATFDGEGNYTGGSIIQHAVVEYAGGAGVSHSGALRIEASSPFIDHNTIENNQNNGIYVWSNGTPHIRSNDIISNSGDGIYADSSSPTIQGNTIRDSSGSGIYVYSFFSGNPTIQGNTITGNAASSGGGIYISYGTAVISGNIITGNTASQGGGISVYSSSPTISNNTITTNTATQENRGGGIYLGTGSLPPINDNDLYGNMTGSPPDTPNDLYNGNVFGSAAVDATNNRWNTTDPLVIEDHIWHFMDDPALGIVSYDPFPSIPCTVLGIIDTDTTWSPGECDHYVVTGSVSVQPGVTLTIQPGTTVKFDSLKVLAVAGTLVAQGTVTDPITFTSNRPSPAAGDWGYIYFAGPSVDATFDGEGNYIGGSIIQHAVVEYAGGAEVSHNGALRIEASSPFIDDCTIEHNQDDGIYVWSRGAPRISGNRIIHHSGAGIYVDTSSPTIQGNTIRDSSGSGIYVYSFFSGNPTIQDNTITGNAASSGGGIYIKYGTAVISGNIITGNAASQGGGISVYSSSPTISNNTITTNTATQNNRGGGIYLDDGCLPTINDNDLYGNMTGSPPDTPNDLYNGNEYGGDAVDATNNRWNTTEWRVIEDHIWHFMDDPALGLVSYDPFPSIPCTALGIIDTDTTWSPSECDPYVVTGHLSVQPGATLTIQPGTTVKFDHLKVLAVAGTLVARGTEANPITFTSNQSRPAGGDWGYIHFAGSSVDATFDGEGNYIGGSIIQHAIVEYAGGANVSNNGALRIEASSPFIDDCTIEHNQDDGIHIWSRGAPHIRGNDITGNSGDGIYVDASNPTIQSNHIVGNSGSGIYVYSFFSGNPTIQGNTITGNAASSGGGIYIKYGTAVIKCNTITGNAASQGGGICLYSTSPTISNNTITDNQATQESRGGGIYLNDGSLPTINDNNLYGNMTGNPANVPNDLYNGNVFGSAAVDARNNYWGTIDPLVIEDHIWHFHDQDREPALAPVIFTPFLTSPVPSCTPTPPIEVTISGPPTGIVDTAYTFTATAGPPTATQPITYAWQATGQSPVTHADGLSDTVTFTWPTTGTKTIIVTASNTRGSAVANHAITIREPGQDVYEPDDTCAQASSMRTDGSPQDHTFHQYADEDWARFTAVSGTTYVVQAVHTGTGADLELELRDACDQPPLPPDDEDTFGNDAHLIFTAPSDGIYYVKALNHDPAVYGPDVTYELSVRTRSPVPIVVIVAGRNEANRLEANITFMGDQAYRTFRRAGVPRENIRYLSVGADRDCDQDGHPDVAGQPSRENVRYAVQDWPSERGLQAGKPFYLYLVDHGGTDYFCADGCGDGKRVSASDLDGWLSDLERDTGADEVNVIVAACYSGSFIDETEDKKATISSTGRVVIASTGSGRRAFPSQRGGYFSDAFFTALGHNADLWTAYVAGRTAARAVWSEQTPWLDDNGDAVADRHDGQVARGRGLVAFDGSIPVVDWLEAGEISESGVATITAQVRDDGAVLTVTVEVYPPGFKAPDTEEGETPVVKIDRVVLEDGDGDGVYEGTYADFAQEGIYRLVAHAWDDDENLSLPRQTNVGEQKTYLPVVARDASTR